MIDYSLLGNYGAAPPPSPTSQDLLVRHLPDLHRAIRSLARHHRLPEAEERDLLGNVLVRLVADDYAVLRKYRGESGIATYLRRVAYRGLLDTRIRRWGKWRPSARARTLGTAAVRFERMGARDGFTATEALAAIDEEPHPAFDRHLADALATEAARRRRRREVPLDRAAAVSVEASQHHAMKSRGLCRRAVRVRTVMRRALRSLSAEDSQLPVRTVRAGAIRRNPRPPNPGRPGAVVPALRPDSSAGCDVSWSMPTSGTTRCAH